MTFPIVIEQDAYAASCKSNGSDKTDLEQRRENGPLSSYGLTTISSNSWTVRKMRKMSVSILSLLHTSECFTDG